MIFTYFSKKQACNYLVVNGVGVMAVRGKDGVERVVAIACPTWTSERAMGYSITALGDDDNRLWYVQRMRKFIQKAYKYNGGNTKRKYFSAGYGSKDYMEKMQGTLKITW